jgi:3',5'-cyclic AMP phosphodiesterase CpdA
MNRRDFIKNTAVVCGGVVVGQNCLAGKMPPIKNGGVLKGFIVSDTHFGWEPDSRFFKPGTQPAPELQAEMMRRIVRRFPDLDVFLDTGDPHDRNLEGIKGDQARGDWTDIVAGGCATNPFFYVPGNHDLSPVNDDPEWRCDSLGSMACRPYYSFDLKGIHFVSLPELEVPTLVNKESIEWLKLDLAINKNRTVILLSHNNIKGTTTPFGEGGYRGVLNSEELLAIMARHPNVIAWMHGHNHTYEVVEKFNKLFVSNGRLGGFIPPPAWGRMGQGHLGGIYFEVQPDKFVVRSYSATAEKFLDEMGDPHLSVELKTRTTLNPAARPAYSYGVGGMMERQKMPVFNHHTMTGKHSELFVSGTDTPALNDDPKFLNYGVYVAGGSLETDWYMGGSSIGPAGLRKENKIWEWLHPGVRLHAQESSEKVVDVCIPDYRHGNFHYRCAPNHQYKAALEIDSPQGGQSLQLQFIFRDKAGKELASVAASSLVLKQGLHTYEAEAQMPTAAAQETIYAAPASDNLIQVMVKATFAGLSSELTLRKFELRAANAQAETVDAAILIDGKRYAHAGPLGCVEPVRFKLPTPASARSVYECQAGGNRRVTWLVRHQALDWQVRNAPVADHGKYLEIGPLRNPWTHRQEVVIAPMGNVGAPYVHRLQNTERVRVHPLNRKNGVLKIEVLECRPAATIIVHCQKAPAQVLGAKDWKYDAPHLSINVAAGDRIQVS